MTWGDDQATKLLGSAIPAGFLQCLAIWEAPVPACQLITLAELKSALGITDAANDDELNRLIGVYSQAVANYTERQLCEAPREVVYVARGYCNVRQLLVPQWPIVSVESVELDGAVLDEDQWYFNGMAGYLYPTAGQGWGINQYLLLKYTAGFDPVPADVQEAMIQMCGSAFNTGSGLAVGPIKRQRVEGAVTEEYFDPRSALGVGSGAGAVGNYTSTLDYYRSERAFI